MSAEPSETIKLFGTVETVQAPMPLRAGSLSAELDGGNLRHIRFDGLEIIRGIAFIIRDKNWGTYNPTIIGLQVEEAEQGFKVTYDAVVKDERQEFKYQATITGTPRSLVFRSEGEAVSEFLTSRAGFVVLHPIDNVAGQRVEIEHVDGRIEHGRFPELIDPVQPMMALRSLAHEAAPGLRVTCHMEGDTFEMEDQRNWTDASYKTYVRPLALPWPYSLAAGTRIEQKVSIGISGSSPARARREEPISLRLGKQVGPAPAIGLGLDPDDIGSTRPVISTLAKLRPRHLVCHHDPRRGHDRATLQEAVSIAAGLDTQPWLEAVVAEIDGFEREIAELGAIVTAMGAPFKVVMLSPASDLKCTLPGSAWPPSPPATEMFRAARRTFPDARIGGGMFSFFTELNRKRPPTAELDLVSFTTGALVHAGDDHSVMEGLEALPAIAASARAIANGRPIAVGPSAIGLRMNPYGEAPVENPHNIRQAMNRNDPRQRGLLGAAWAVGYYARLAASVEAITFGGTTGPFGLAHTPENWPAPWYDDFGGVFPVFHALRCLARLAGRMTREIKISNPNAVQGICVEDSTGSEMILANLTPDPQHVVLPAVANGIALVDSSCFVEAAHSPEITDRLNPVPDPSAVTLGAFAVARIRLA